MQPTIDQMIIQNNIPLMILNEFNGVKYLNNKTELFKVPQRKFSYNIQLRNQQKITSINVKNLIINNVNIDKVTFKKNKILVRVKIANKKKRYKNYSLHNYLKNNLSFDDFTFNYKLIKVNAVKNQLYQF